MTAEVVAPLLKPSDPVKVPVQVDVVRWVDGDRPHLVDRRVARYLHPFEVAGRIELRDEDSRAARAGTVHQTGIGSGSGRALVAPGDIDIPRRIDGNGLGCVIARRPAASGPDEVAGRIELCDVRYRFHRCSSDWSSNSRWRGSSCRKTIPRHRHCRPSRPPSHWPRPCRFRRDRLPRPDCR